jgi:hypothetical protein
MNTIQIEKNTKQKYSMTLAEQAGAVEKYVEEGPNIPYALESCADEMTATAIKIEDECAIIFFAVLKRNRFFLVCMCKMNDHQ